MYIGMDAGGTKTDICVCTSEGAVIARKTGCGINAAKSGPAAAAEALASLVSSAGITSATSLYAGTAGAGSAAIAEELKMRLSSLLPGIGNISVASDAFNGLNSVVGLGDGVALIAGTGSSAFLRQNGIIRQAGGRGYLIDDAGSGYHTGKACLDAAFRHIDGRGGYTQLTEAAEKKLVMPLTQAIPALYEGGVPMIASFAPIVFECASAGDLTAKEIAKNCAAELWLMVRACTSACSDVPGICAATGGMFRSEYLRELILSNAEGSGINIVFPSLPPVAGAVIAAAGSAADEKFINRLKGDLNGLQ